MFSLLLSFRRLSTKISRPSTEQDGVFCIPRNMVPQIFVDLFEEYDN